MKLNNIFYGLAATLMTLCLTGCDEEKDPIIIEGDLPIKTSVLYMVGDATQRLGDWQPHTAPGFCRRPIDILMGRLALCRRNQTLLVNRQLGCSIHPSGEQWYRNIQEQYHGSKVYYARRRPRQQMARNVCRKVSPLF